MTDLHAPNVGYCVQRSGFAPERNAQIAGSLTLSGNTREQGRSDKQKRESKRPSGAKTHSGSMAPLIGVERA
jgi:hypothetical protein